MPIRPRDVEDVKWLVQCLLGQDMPKDVVLPDSIDSIDDETTIVRFEDGTQFEVTVQVKPYQPR